MVDGLQLQGRLLREPLRADWLAQLDVALDHVLQEQLLTVGQHRSKSRRGLYSPREDRLRSEYSEPSALAC